MAELTPSTIRALDARLRARMAGQAASAALAAGLVLEQRLKLTLSTPPARSGRLYPRGARMHRASAPGEPPAPDTGTLRASVRTDQAPSGVVTVRVQTPYAVVLEFGAPERNLASRPYFRPTLQAARAAMRQAGLTVRAGVRGRFHGPVDLDG